MRELENTEVAIRNHPSYKISREGVVSNKYGRTLKGMVDRCGYHEVSITEHSKSKWFFVHRLVAEAFLPNPDNLPFVNHKNGNKLDNSVENLEWCTRSENALHSFKNGLQTRVSNRYGTFRVLTEEDLNFIRDSKSLGYMTDKDVAEVLGCSRELVGRKRREMNL